MAILSVTYTEKQTVNGIETEVEKTVDLPDPSEMSVIVQDIDAATTTRNAKGEMLRDRVRGGDDAPRKIECEWAGLPIGTVSKLLHAIAGEFFKLKYPDTYTGTTREAEFYSGDRTAKVYKVLNGHDSAVFETVKANFIEK